MICPICNTDFEPNPSFKNTKYCGVKCRNRACKVRELERLREKRKAEGRIRQGPKPKVEQKRTGVAGLSTKAITRARAREIALIEKVVAAAKAKGNHVPPDAFADDWHTMTLKGAKLG